MSTATKLFPQRRLSCTQRTVQLNSKPFVGLTDSEGSKCVSHRVARQSRRRVTRIEAHEDQGTVDGGIVAQPPGQGSQMTPLRPAMRRDDEALSLIARPVRKSGKVMSPCYPDEDWKTVGPKLMLRRYNKVLLKWAKSGEMRKAEQMLEQAKREGYKPDVVMYGSLMHGFYKSDNRRRVFELYNEMKRAGVKPNEYVFHALITACKKAGEIRRAELLFSEMQESYGIKPGARVYYALLKVCLRSGNVEKVKKIVNDMIRRGFQETAFMLSILIAVYSKAANEENGKEYLAECKTILAKIKKKGFKLTSRMYDNIIRLCARAEMMEEGRKMLDEMKRNAVETSSYSHCLLMESYAETVSAETAVEYLRRCRELMNEMEKDGSPAASIAYNSIIKLCNHALMVEEAHEVLEEMKEKGVTPTIHTYNMIFSLYAKVTNVANGRERVKHSKELIREMRMSGIQPSDRTYRCMIKICTEGKMMEMPELLKSMRKDDVEIDLDLYNVLICFYAETANHENGVVHLAQCRRLINEMKNDGISSDATTRAALLELCTRAGLKDEAFEVLETIEENGEDGTNDEYYTLLHLYSSTADIENGEEYLKKSKEILDKLRGNGFLVVVRQYNFLIKICLRARMVEEAHNLFDEMKEKGIIPDSRSYSMLVELYAETTDLDNGERRLKQSRELMDEMKRKDVRADGVTFNAIIKLCIRAKMLEKALEVLEEMKAKGVPPSIHTYFMLLIALAKAINNFNGKERLEQSRKLLSEMQDYDIPVNSPVYKAIIMISIRAREVKEAFKMLDEMKANGVQPDASTYAMFINELSGSRSMSKGLVAESVDRLWNLMNQEGLPQETDVYVSLIYACMKTGDLNKMEMYFEKMKEMGVTLPPGVHRDLIEFHKGNGVLRKSKGGAKK